MAASLLIRGGEADGERTQSLELLVFVFDVEDESLLELDDFLSVLSLLESLDEDVLDDEPDELSLDELEAGDDALEPARLSFL